MTGKKRTREAISKAIAGLRTKQRIVFDARIGTRITRLRFWGEATTVIGYMAMEDEVDLTAVLRAAQHAGKVIGLPRVEDASATMTMTMRRVVGFPLNLERHPFGMLQPHHDAPEITDATNALLLVPGRAFDRNGHRIGRGAGYFDAYLSRCGRPLATVGVAYSVQLLSLVPTDERDRSVQIVITDRETCYCSRP